MSSSSKDRFLRDPEELDLIEDYQVRVLMRLILMWGFTIKECAYLFEQSESSLRRRMKKEIERAMKFQ